MEQQSKLQAVLWYQYHNLNETRNYIIIANYDIIITSHGYERLSNTVDVVILLVQTSGNVLFERNSNKLMRA